MELQGIGEGIDSWKEVNLIYNAALRQVETKMEILNEEFQHVHQYNPIEHIKSRIKSPESIVKKLKRQGFEVLDIACAPLHFTQQTRAARYQCCKRLNTHTGLLSAGSYQTA